MDRETIARRLESNLERVLGQCAASDADLAKRYGAGKWTVRQVLAHLADAEFVNYWRFCRAVAEPGSHVEPFEEGRWERTLDYATRPSAVSRDLFAGARRALVHHARSLSAEALDGACLHPEKGRMSGAEWLTLIFDHAEHHLGQIEAARAGRAWDPQYTKDSWRYGAGPKPV